MWNGMGWLAKGYGFDGRHYATIRRETNRAVMEGRLIGEPRTTLGEDGS
jgi:hypothetical protein